MYEQPNNELMHYGVLGMRLGMTRNRQATIGKAYKKLGRLDDDIANKSRAASKAAVKVGTGASKKYMNLRDKANKYKARYEKRTNVAAQTKDAENKARAKADKWAKKMDKYITETETSELNSEQIALARKYLGM